MEYNVKKIIGITAMALFFGAAIASAQSIRDTDPFNGPAVRADESAGTVIPRRDDPDSTNSNRVDRSGAYHNEVAPDGTVTGPLSTDRGGGG